MPLPYLPKEDVKLLRNMLKAKTPALFPVPDCNVRARVYIDGASHNITLYSYFTELCHMGWRDTEDYVWLMKIARGYSRTTAKHLRKFLQMVELDVRLAAPRVWKNIPSNTALNRERLNDYIERYY